MRINIMIDRITDSQWAFYLARSIGNRDIIIDKIINQMVACIWALKWPYDKQYLIYEN